MITTIIDKIKYGKKIPIALDYTHNLKCIYLHGNKRLLYNIEDGIYLVTYTSSQYYMDTNLNKMQMIKRGFFLIDEYIICELLCELTTGEILIPKKCSFIKKNKNFHKINYPYDLKIIYSEIENKNQILDLSRKIKLNYIKDL